MNKNKKKTEHACSGVATFDFEKIYKSYPRKKGKGDGLRKCALQIRTQDDYDKLTLAVVNFKSDMTNEGREINKILYFSTFMNNWRDFVEIEESQPLTMSANEKIIEYLKTQTEDVEDWSYHDWD